MLSNQSNSNWYKLDVAHFHSIEMWAEALANEGEKNITGASLLMPRQDND